MNRGTIKFILTIRVLMLRFGFFRYASAQLFLLSFSFEKKRREEKKIATLMPFLGKKLVKSVLGTKQENTNTFNTSTYLTMFGFVCAAVVYI